MFSLSLPADWMFNSYTLHCFCFLKSRSQETKNGLGKRMWVLSNSSEFSSDASLCSLLSSLSSSISLLISFVSLWHWHIFLQADFRHLHTIISSTDSGVDMFSIHWIFKRSSKATHDQMEMECQDWQVKLVSIHRTDNCNV